MCGIHFVINGGASDPNLASFMRDAFITNQVRGTDSSGLFQVKTTFSPKHKGCRQVSHFKQAVHGTVFLEHPDVESMLRESAWQLATVGHVRAATHGSVTDENAHPFLTVREDGSRIIGVHNGSLDGWKTKKDADKFNVDSAWLFSKLATDGAEAFKGFNGAFALVWYDSNHPNKLFVARNERRPLHFAFSQNQRAVVACSELGMLGWLAERNNIKLHKNDDGFYFLFMEPGHIYTFDLNKPTEMTKVPFSEYDPNAKMYDTPSNNGQFGFYHARSIPWRDNTTYRSPAYSTESYYESRQKTVLDGIKEALKVARTRRENAVAGTGTAEAEVVDSVALEEGMAKEIESYLRTKHGLSIENEFTTDLAKQQLEPVPNAGACTKNEVVAAKEAGYFGMIVGFEGIWHDPDESNCYGTFTLNDGKRDVSHDAVVRFKTDAHSQKYTKGLTPMTIVGLTTNGTWTHWVVEELQASTKRRNLKYPSDAEVNRLTEQQSAARMLH